MEYWKRAFRLDIELAALCSKQIQRATRDNGERKKNMDGELDVEAVSGREAGTGNDFNRERAKIRYAVAELNIL